MTRSPRAVRSSPPSMWRSLTCAKSTIASPIGRRRISLAVAGAAQVATAYHAREASDRKVPLTTPHPNVSSLSTLARIGFEEPEAAAADLERLGAWPPSAAPGGNRLLSDVAASAAPQLA